MYELRFFFDAGSGICLWAKNSAARNRFGYPVDLGELPLSENTRRWLQYLIGWFDTSLNWDSPGDVRPHWTEEETQRFKKATQSGYEMLCNELPISEYAVANEAGAR